MPPRLVAGLHDAAGAARWNVSLDAFGAALARSAEKAFGADDPAPRDLERYLRALHLDELALSCACADGDPRAWDHFVETHRPVLYRAADALDPSGAAREIADALYAELYGVREKDGVRQSLFRYFHGRSSLATWLRAVLSQRYVDRIRASRRESPLPDDDEPAKQPRTEPAEQDPKRPSVIALVVGLLQAAIDVLPARDRLRFGSYYGDGLTLAQTGRVTGEHEATVSRQLARTRRDLRRAVERRLRDQHGFGDRQVAEALEEASRDAGELDLARWSTRKEAVPDRSV